MADRVTGGDSLSRTAIIARIEAATGRRNGRLSRLSGGSVGEVYRCDFDRGEPVVLKVDRSSSPLLTIEAEMLAYLARHTELPIPGVIAAEPRLLILSYIDGNSSFSPQAQGHAADLLADLHDLTAPSFGFLRDEGQQFDTLIGSLHQPNPPADSWLDFFRDQRLLYMAGEAALAGQLPMEFLPRLERLASNLDRFIDEPDRPSLIHGDVWTTNVLARGDQIVGFLDPAIYYADPEIELAFTTLFGTFSGPFFERYQERRPLAPGFFETRRDLYNLYPLLVHVRLFGGSYVQGIGRILKKFGY